MRNRQRIVGVRPRSNIVVPCPFLHIDFHANGGDNTSIAYERRLPGESSVSEDTIALINGAAGDWVTGGIEPQGTSHVLLNDQSLDSLFAIDSSTQQIVMMMRTDRSVNPVANQYLMQWGAPSRQAPGGLTVELQSSGQIRAGFFPGSTATSGVAAQKSSGAAEMSIMCVWDVANAAIYAATSGDLAGAGDAAGTFAASIAEGNNPTSTSGNYGFSLFAQHNAPVSTGSSIVNSGGGSENLQISDLWVLRTQGDDFDKLDEVFEEFTNSPTEKRLRSFRGLTAG